jgi:hypothetical protein
MQPILSNETYLRLLRRLHKSATQVPWWVHTLRGLDIQLCGSCWHLASEKVVN